MHLKILISQKLRNVNRLSRTTELIEAGGTKFANTTVWAAMIQTDPTVAGILGRDFHKVPQGVNGSAVDNAWARVEHAKKMTIDLPFSVSFWWSVYAPNCPTRNAKGNDRGVSMAHYQIWADFEFQGRHKRGKDRLIASDSDVLIVFEDDAVIAVKDVKASLEVEISDMSTDLLFLGWCYGRRGMLIYHNLFFNCLIVYEFSWIDHCLFIVSLYPFLSLSTCHQWYHIIIMFSRLNTNIHMHTQECQCVLTHMH